MSSLALLSLYIYIYTIEKAVWPLPVPAAPGKDFKIALPTRASSKCKKATKVALARQLAMSNGCGLAYIKLCGGVAFCPGFRICLWG